MKRRTYLSVLAGATTGCLGVGGGSSVEKPETEFTGRNWVPYGEWHSGVGAIRDYKAERVEISSEFTVNGGRTYSMPEGRKLATLYYSMRNPESETVKTNPGDWHVVGTESAVQMTAGFDHPEFKYDVGVSDIGTGRNSAPFDGELDPDETKRFVVGASVNEKLLSDPVLTGLGEMSGKKFDAIFSE